MDTASILPICHSTACTRYNLTEVPGSCSIKLVERKLHPMLRQRQFVVLLSGLILCIMLALFGGIRLMAQAQTNARTTARVNARSAPSSDGSILTIFPMDARLLVVA